MLSTADKGINEILAMLSTADKGINEILAMLSTADGALRNTSNAIYC